MHRAGKFGQAFAGANTADKRGSQDFVVSNDIQIYITDWYIGTFVDQMARLSKEAPCIQEKVNR